MRASMIIFVFLSFNLGSAYADVKSPTYKYCTSSKIILFASKSEYSLETQADVEKIVYHLRDWFKESCRPFLPKNPPTVQACIVHIQPSELPLAHRLGEQELLFNERLCDVIAVSGSIVAITHLRRGTCANCWVLGQ
jgi:hypothetical protein